MKNGQGAGITSRALTVLWREFSRDHRTMQAAASAGVYYRHMGK